MIGTRVELDVKLYVRQDCDLCEAMYDEFMDWIDERGLREHLVLDCRDIDSRDEWLQAYDRLVPVLVVNGDQLCHFFFDPVQLDLVLLDNSA